MAKICKNCACYEVCFMANPCRTEDCNIAWAPVVVRCKDCVWGEYAYTEFDDYYECRYAGGDWNRGDHFCSYGERRRGSGNKQQG